MLCRLSKKPISRFLSNLIHCRTIKEWTFLLREPLSRYEFPHPLGEMVTAATFYSQANKILHELPRELAFSKQGKTRGQELNFSWEIRAKASEWYCIRLGQQSLWLQGQQCIFWNRCRPHGREGQWSCIGSYLVGHLKRQGELQRSWNKATYVQIKRVQGQ